MLVQGASSTASAGPKAVRRERGAATFRLGSAGGAGGVVAAGSAAVSSIDTLLALQGMDGPDAMAERAIAHGEDLLDRLRDLQADLLAGRFDRRSLEDLARAASSGLPEGADAALGRIVRDIEVRASVELAKLDVDHEETATAPLSVDFAPPPPSPPRAACLRAYRDLGAAGR